MEKRGRETKILKRGQAGPRGVCLKKGGLEPPTSYAIVELDNMIQFSILHHMLQFSRKFH